MKELYIYHHMGLGDHIICNAIVRNYAIQNDKIYLFVKPHNYENVSFMYRDLNNIEYLQGDDWFAHDYIRDNKINNLLIIGFDKLNNSINFDRSFYEQIGMNFEKKWTDFYFKRDMEKEMNLFNSLNLKENEYIFINEDRKRNFLFDKNKYRQDLKIVNSDLDCGLFDLCYIMENALEVHLMESSLKCLSEHIDIKTNSLFYHTYVRNYPPTIRVSSKRNWIVL